jgi:hypothetical protein
MRFALLAAAGLLIPLVAPAQAAYELRFAPPEGYSQDFDVDVRGSAEARGRKVNFEGDLTMNQTVVEVPDEEMQPLTVELTMTGGTIRYDDREKPPRYIGDPLTAHRSPMGAIMDVSKPLDDDDETGIDVTAAILYATSLLVFPERAARPGEDWDGSHEAFDPYGDYVPVTAENYFGDLLELPDRTLVRVDSEGEFPYRAKIDDDWLYGTLKYALAVHMDLDTGSVVEAELRLYGELKAKASFVTVGISVEELYVHVKETSHEVVDLEERAAAQEEAEQESDEGDGEEGGD